jgi:hypothetical protein
MITARFIHTVVNGKEELFSTTNFDGILNDKNLLPLLSSNMQGEQSYYDDKAISYTTVTPNQEPHGRSYTTTDSVICKFSDTELISYLKPEEIMMLLRRINNKLNLTSRMAFAQNTGDALKNPLMEVKL